jgi:hypothetical protein
LDGVPVFEKFGGEGVNIVKMIKLLNQKMRWMGSVLHMQQTRTALRILAGKVKG